MKLTAQHIDWLNIVLMIVAAAAAYVLPFEVFLFSYAVLGPLHYLTEISWLHERSYFTTGARDVVVLLLLGLLLFSVSFIVPVFSPPPQDTAPVAAKQAYRDFQAQSGATIIYLAFMAALAMTVFRTVGSKVLFMLLAGVFLMALAKVPAWVLLFAVFLPTLVHVYVFTSAFMLLGALKSRSVPGLLAFVLLLVLGGFLLFYRTEETLLVSEQVRTHYRLFIDLNNWVAKLFGESWVNHDQAYQTSLGISLMRFIAFAYTYHYLNWFSKTTVIKWHQVNQARLVAIVVLWLIAVGLYWWNYRYGFIALYTLSFLHVFLEFPLNWRSFVELGKEVKTIGQHGWAKPMVVKPAG
jgi:hypothetical protein